jgi:Ca2+-binding RTX toxin-like protein
MADAFLNLADLDGNNGFALNGIDEFDSLGGSVSGAGDINGDGIDDLIVGAPGANNFAGQSYVVFGSPGGFPANLELTDLDGTNGFALNGIGTDGVDQSGFSVSGAGDVNGDDLDDLIVGAIGANNFAGQGYVVFGSPGGFPASLDLVDLDGSNGFTLNGINTGDNLGHSVSGTGDINGDGIDDLIVGANRAEPNGPYSGQSYVVFGSSEEFPANLELTDLDGTNGFALNGINKYDFSGISVSGAGDINGDGFDDLIIGAYSNQSYVVFGSSEGFPASLELADLDGTNGFALNGVTQGDISGESVSGAGDINGDGIDDLIVGASGADPNGIYNAGQSYVVFGSSEGFPASLELADLDGSNGFALNGINEDDRLGLSVSGTGDINGDGFDDLIVGAPYADPAGQSYVVFGSSEEFPASLELADLDGSNGFALNGSFLDRSGYSVSGAGDINRDGFDDLIVGAFAADPNGINNAGQSYVVFGFETEGPTQPPIFGTPEDDELNISDGSVIVFAGDGEDLVDASQSSGNNQLFGGAGNDELFASSNDRLFGEAGKDILNAAVGTGNNRLYGGDGNDILFAGVSDRLFGGDGDDLLFAGDGESLLNGGQGEDQFWIANAALPSSPNTIADFELDADVLGIGGLGLNFDDLSLTQQGDDALIAALDTDIAILTGIQASDLDSDNFVFV